MDGFTPWGTSHLVVVTLAVVGLLTAAALGRVVRRTEREPRVSRRFALALPVVLVPLQAIDLLPGRFDLDTTLPLQLCDLAWIAAAAALWTRHRVPVALTYFWGLALTTQALITPDLAAGFPDPKFLGFAALHLLVPWAAGYLAFGLGLGPSWRDLRSTVVITLTWLVGVFAVNLALGTNYGFVNGKPSGGSVLDLLPSWPAYVVLEAFIVTAVFTLMTLPWVLLPRHRAVATVAAC